MSSPPRSESPAPAVIVTTPDQLRALVRAEVDAALEAHREGEAPRNRLLRAKDACRVLACSEPMLRRWREAGMPVVWCGDQPRYDADACVDWLRAQPKGGADAE